MNYLPVLLVALTLLAAGCNGEGAAIYQKDCAGCHRGGLAGAPAMGDQAAWAERIAKGEATLLRHAIEGYTGRDGIMPARGGNPRLTDDQVRAATRYMIERSR